MLYHIYHSITTAALIMTAMVVGAKPRPEPVGKVVVVIPPSGALVVAVPPAGVVVVVFSPAGAVAVVIPPTGAVVAVVEVTDLAVKTQNNLITTGIGMFMSCQLATGALLEKCKYM